MPLEDNIVDDLNPGEGTAFNDDGTPVVSEGEGSGNAESYYLRDLTEDTVYDRLNTMGGMPETMTAMESRFNGSLGELGKRLEGMEKAVPTQANFDVEKLTKGLEAYDPKLAEVLGPLLQEAFKTAPMDETALRPYLDPLREQMSAQMGEQLVMSVYSPEDIAEIIPPVEGGSFAPQGQRHKDFVDWYSKQGYDTQRALLNFGAPYITALRKFEKFEAKINKDRAGKAEGLNQRLENGQMPSSNKNTPTPSKGLSDDEAFAAGFDEIFKEAS